MAAYNAARPPDYSISASRTGFAASMRATAASIAPAATPRHSPSPTQSGDAASACRIWDAPPQHLLRVLEVADHFRLGHAWLLSLGGFAARIVAPACRLLVLGRRELQDKDVRREASILRFSASRKRG